MVSVSIEDPSTLIHLLVSLNPFCYSFLFITGSPTCTEGDPSRKTIAVTHLLCVSMAERPRKSVYSGKPPVGDLTLRIQSQIYTRHSRH